MKVGNGIRNEVNYKFGRRNYSATIKGRGGWRAKEEENKKCVELFTLNCIKFNWELIDWVETWTRTLISCRIIFQPPVRDVAGALMSPPERHLSLSALAGESRQL